MRTPKNLGTYLCFLVAAVLASGALLEGYSALREDFERGDLGTEAAIRDLTRVGRKSEQGHLARAPALDRKSCFRQSFGRIWNNETDVALVIPDKWMGNIDPESLSVSAAGKSVDYGLDGNRLRVSIPSTGGAQAVLEVAYCLFQSSDAGEPDPKTEVEGGILIDEETYCDAYECSDGGS